MKNLSFTKVAFKAEDLLSAAEKLQVVGGYGRCHGVGERAFYCSCNPGWWPIESAPLICSTTDEDAVDLIGQWCNPGDQPSCYETFD